MGALGTSGSEHAGDLQEDFPANGTSLNPLHEEWLFFHEQASSGDGLQEIGQGE